MCYLVQISESDPRITRDLQTGGVVLQLQVLHSERRSEGLRVFLAGVKQGRQSGYKQPFSSLHAFWQTWAELYL